MLKRSLQVHHFNNFLDIFSKSKINFAEKNVFLKVYLIEIKNTLSV